MEGAGASNVSHAAETREMDSADEEPELPSAVQKLILRLEGEGKPTRWLPQLTKEEFRDFFPPPELLSTISGWRSQVRLRILEAIGNCNRFEFLNFRAICGYKGSISTLNACEWEVLLRAFRDSTVLQEIIIPGLEVSSDDEWESLCFQIGRILNTSSVQVLRIDSTNLSARCFLNLASGLRGNSDSKLQALKLESARIDSSAVKHVADMINSATRLESLIIDSIDDMEEENVRILSQALMKSSSLKTLTLLNMKWGEALLLNAFAGDDRNRSIERLVLGRWERLGDRSCELLTSNPSLKEVTLSYLKMRPEEWHQVGEVIRDKAGATNITVQFGLQQDVREEWESIEALAFAASSDVQDPRLALQMVHHSDQGSCEHGFMLSMNLLGRVLRGDIKSLKSLRIWANFITSGTNQDRLESILSMNGKTGETSVLKRLALHILNRDLHKGLWKDLLGCLRGNTSLTHLQLYIPKVDGEEAFRDLMGLLEVNLTLQEIDVRGTSWIMEGKEAQIQEALKQNQKRAVYMSEFRKAKLTFGDAKAGRLFLCGSPRAGKTKLRQTLMRIVQGKSWLGNKWDQLWRTKGVEVEFLQNNDQGQISVWDLAGQEIFRTLQNVLFPQTSNFCVFLFVYSQFCEKSSFRKPDSCFQTELEDWLSFITSNTRVTGHIRPQVLVVISHKDKIKSSSLTWAHSIMDELNKKFQKFVDLHPLQECFHVDARKKKQVIPLKNHIFDIFKKLLSEKSPQVSQLCSQLSYLLATNTKENKSCPLWPSQKFYEFCTPSLTQFISYSSPHAIDHSRIMRSIISYLNDVGSIVYIPNLDYIIVDPNWLTNTLLGELVAIGQNFQAQELGSSDKTMSRDSYTSKDGFVSESVFAGLIEEFLLNQPHVERGVDRETLENILINLDLCFKLEDTSQYFIPSFIREHASMEDQKHQVAEMESMAWKTRDETSQFVGIRIQCADGRTMSMTAAFFPCFQMFMRRKLISEMHVSKEMVTCSRHYLRLFLDGHQIYVQQGKSHKYVDVLMLCSKHKSREGALKYVMKHIVHELISFCASPKGCPGVALMLGVIQTLCVEMLIPSDLRGTILIEELKSKFIRSIKDKLEDLPLDKLQLEKEEELFNYEHSWPLIEGYTTQVIFERARDLLWESDVEAVVNEIREKQMQHLESLQQALIKQLENLQQGLIKVNNDLIHSYPENENVVTSSNFLDMKDSNRPSSRCLSRASTSVENRSAQRILSKFDQLGQKFDQLGQKVDGLDERLRSMESIVKRLDIKLGQILSLQQQLQFKLSAFMSKVDRFIQYSYSLQQARTPKRPYVTDDVGIFYRISALLHVGTTIRLHLMCESATGFHPVKDQEGLKIRLDRENCQWIRKTIEISFKIMYYAAKAGLEKTLGLGQAIPDWEDLKSDIVKLDGISDRDRRAVLKGGESKELKEAWLRIQQTLAPQLQDSYSAIFKLYQVKYVSLELGGHAWVCEECMNKGRSSGILTF
ncbi:hypothetical protein MPTK1_7g12460 [Marchantia polymorpha subsp. ruderalis]|uniref:C-terminal of Roc (COR) domain-containing protein n=1 Tax=Marchantia polymorpha subsp. ruderalis TaxID=1480154 RepID=A0AAF6BYS6_MARPO|nr:hypothetical protein Mp_7g12460 [Marchantia polymorpha subsp. ruderalis]